MFESLTVTVKLKVPDALGVPDITPVEGSSDKLVGNAPEDTVHDEYEGVPPAAVRVCEYADVIVTAGKDDVATVGAAFTTIDNDF